MGAFTQALPEQYALRCDEFSRELFEIGITYVGHGFVNKKPLSPQKHTAYFSNREWKNIYINENIFFKEPILESFLGNPRLMVSSKAYIGDPVSEKRRSIVSAQSFLTLASFHDDLFGFLSLGFSDDRGFDVAFLKEYFFLLQSYHSNYDTIHMDWWKKESMGKES